MKKVNVFFAWYDFWVGWYYNERDHILYICPLPMIVIQVKLFLFEWFRDRFERG